MSEMSAWFVARKGAFTWDHMLASSPRTCGSRHIEGKNVSSY